MHFHDGRRVMSAADWAERRVEILRYWHKVMGPWPALIEKPKIEYLTTTNRENFTQHRVRVEIGRRRRLADLIRVHGLIRLQRARRHAPDHLAEIEDGLRIDRPCARQGKRATDSAL